MLLGLVLGQGAVLPAENPETLLNRWLATHTNLQSLGADFVQTRTLRSLTQPLTTPGRLWFAAPASFRWELGNPAQTIAVRQTHDLWVIYPVQKRAERYELQGANSHWRETLALLEAGFPRSRAELEARYRIASLTLTNELLVVVLIPRHVAARRLIPELSLGVGATDHRLRFTSLKMADGSQMRQDYTNIVHNPAWTESPFKWAPPADYQVVEPLARRPRGP
ncbi:MAG: outer membrane lipoprotein carrier protein LolA [Verrucomicrobiae bacterium]|nr:outer membrane lipoprotein carrier protein LolA [Verrucomicrobiae bacterium]